MVIQVFWDVLTKFSPSKAIQNPLKISPNKTLIVKTIISNIIVNMELLLENKHHL